MPSYTLSVMPQFLHQMEGPMKIYNRGKFDLYGICGSQVINVQRVLWRCSIYEVAHFGGVLDLFFPKSGWILLR